MHEPSGIIDTSSPMSRRSNLLRYRIIFDSVGATGEPYRDRVRLYFEGENQQLVLQVFDDTGSALAWSNDILPAAEVRHLVTPQTFADDTWYHISAGWRSTKPGDLVIDPFSGSGTTHVACKRSGRRFSGADLFYDEMANERAGQATMDTSCPLPGVTEKSMAVWQAEARATGMTPSSIAESMQEELFA